MTLPIDNLWDSKGNPREKACTTPTYREEPRPSKRRIRATKPQRAGGSVHVTTVKD